MARKAVLALGKLGTRFPDKNLPIIKQLSSYIKINKVHLMDEIVISFSKILTASSNNINEMLVHLESLGNQITSIESKISLVWILGNFGDKLDTSPYLLENFIDELCNKNKDNQDEDEPDANDIFNSPAFKLQLITSCVKIFMCKPAEIHPGLCK